MTFCIITHTPHSLYENKVYAYGPYIKEMNLWVKYVDKVIIVAPCKEDSKVSPILLPYEHSNIEIRKIPAISLTSFFELVKAILNTPVIKLKIFLAMLKSNHIHLRCPGNIGLYGAGIQVFFPRKTKTAKYAGNWDPMAKQPFSYRIQKWILSNTFLTRNMKVLVYGQWEHQSKNINSFFTASYSKLKALELSKKNFQSPFKFLFVGSLSKGKNPLYAVQLVERLLQKGISCSLDVFGEGVERKNIESYISNQNLDKNIVLHGNQSAELVEKAYKDSHFLLLPSQSEGWPKVVAEAMFWGLVPIVTSISCVPWMLKNGARGILITKNVAQDVQLINEVITHPLLLNKMSKEAQQWSREYTLDAFEKAIKNLLENESTTSN